MENLHRMQSLIDDGSTVQGWPYVQHEFFPGQGMKDLSTGQNHSSGPGVSLDGTTMIQYPWGWENVAAAEAANATLSGSKHWRDSWEWDSLLFTAQPSGVPVSRGTVNRSTQNVENQAEEAVSNSASPSEKSDVNGSLNESNFLELGIKNNVEDDSLLALKLGKNEYSFDGAGLPPSVKRTRHSPPEIQQPRCQVDNCTADLRNSKDYHRRHKVCEMHAKALKAPVSRMMQRFCQQCSRFHLLQEFDENRKSCRRRLAGHNRRRRKTQPDAAAALACLLADQTPLAQLLNVLGQDQGKGDLEKLLGLLSGGDALLRTLLTAKLSSGHGDNRSNVSGGSANELINMIAKSQLLSSLLPSNPLLISKLASGLPLESQVSVLSNLLSSVPHLQQNKTSMDEAPGSKQEPHKEHMPYKQNIPAENMLLVPERRDGHFRHAGPEQLASFSNAYPVNAFSEMEPPIPQKSVNKTTHQITSSNDGVIISESNTSRVMDHGPGAVMNIENGMSLSAPNLAASFARDFQTVAAPEHADSLHLQLDSGRVLVDEHVGTPALGSDQSSDSGFDKQDYTFQIWFKIFDRGPGELPSGLREQMLDWLDHLPTEMQGYIRPGCIILAMFVRMPIYYWEKLKRNIVASLLKLVQSNNGEFWRKGRVLVQLGRASAFIIDGKVFPNIVLKPNQAPHLLLVRPFAVIMGENAQILIKGYNLKLPGAKVICSYGGKSIDREVSLLGSRERKREREGQKMDLSLYNAECEQVLTFNVGPFNSMGHGFIEVEGRILKGNMFPILVTDRSICEEVSSLEEEFESSCQSRRPSERLQQTQKQADILHFLYELGWLFEREQWKSNHKEMVIQEFSAGRYKWLLKFTCERSWCAVVRKILDLLFANDGEMNMESSKALAVLSEVNLLHVAVKNNSRSMVEALLAYCPQGLHADHPHKRFVFRPDAPGPNGLTPLHIAAGMCGADGVIDLLTNSPEEIWVSAWTSGKDSVGQTPLMYAIASGNQAYVHMVQRKLQRIGKTRGLQEARNDAIVTDGHKSSQVALNIVTKGGDISSLVSSSRAVVRKNQQCTCSRSNLSQCRVRLGIRGLNGSAYRPFVLSMLAVAAICVCVGVLMKGPPKVYFVPPPFVWESIHFGVI